MNCTGYVAKTFLPENFIDYYSRKTIIQEDYYSRKTIIQEDYYYSKKTISKDYR